MPTITVPISEELLTSLRALAIARGTTVEKLLMERAESLCRQWCDNAAASAGNAGDDDINGYKTYYEHMERKHR